MITPSSSTTEATSLLWDSRRAGHVEKAVLIACVTRGRFRYSTPQSPFAVAIDTHATHLSIPLDLNSMPVAETTGRAPLLRPMATRKAQVHLHATRHFSGHAYRANHLAIKRITVGCITYPTPWCGFDFPYRSARLYILWSLIEAIDGSRIIFL